MPRASWAARHTTVCLDRCMLNKMGPRTEPCGTPLITSDQSDRWPLKTTFCFLPTRKFLIHSRTWPDIPQPYNIDIKRLCGTESKAFWRSKYNTSTEWPSSSAFVHLLMASRRRVEQDLPGVNPCCSDGILLLAWRRSWTLSLMIDSMILQIGEVKLIPGLSRIVQHSILKSGRVTSNAIETYELHWDFWVK